MALLARSRKHDLPLRPHRHFLLALILVLTVGLFLLEGSVVLPLFLVAVASLVNVFLTLRKARKATESPNATAAAANRIHGVYLAVCLGIVPVAFLVVFLRRP